MSAAVAASSAPSSVHVEIPGAKALSERGYWGSCGLIAELDALHCCPWGNIPMTDAASTYAKLVQWRSEYHAAINPATGQPRGSATGVTTLGNIYWHLKLHANHIAAYIPYGEPANLTAVHNLLKQQCVAGNPVIIQVANAAALPHNEQGVAYHFVTLVGIDSTLGYLVANGDTTEALTTTHPFVALYWATWQQLVNAKICGAIALDAHWSPPAPPPPPVTPPPPVVSVGLADAISQAEALVAALKAMQQLQVTP